MSRHRTGGVDLDDTSRCPLGHRCESCGIEASAGTTLTVATVATQIGTLCLTLCDHCAGSSEPPPITVSTAQRLVAQHADHLDRTTP